MDARTFVLAYPREPAPPRSYGPRVDKLLVHSRRFAQGFGRVLHDALSGRPLPQRTQFRTWAVRYTTWLNQGMGGLEQNLEELLDALESAEDFPRVFMEINFHRLNGPVMSWWEDLLFDRGAKGIDASRVTRARYELAKTAMAVMRSRDDWVERGLFYGKDLSEVRQWATGALTEMDGMVALLEMSRRMPSTFVVPAPPQFEHMAGPANIDLIVIDTSNGYRVRGVQLKSSGAHRHADRYDPDRVTLIDGSVDMFNELAVRRNPRRSDKDVVSWPGLVSAHYLASVTPGPETDGWATQPEIRAAAAMASQATKSVVSRNQQICDALIERIVADLGPVEENVDGQRPGVPPTH